MKQTIEYYYNLIIDELYIDRNNNYYFIKDNSYYYFIFYNRTNDELKDIVKCINELKIKNIPVHEIIMNNQNDYLTKIDEVSYVLIKANKINNTYNILDIIDYNKKLVLINSNNNLYRNNWAKLWSDKIDYIEDQLKEIKIDNIIYNSIDYYIGLTENAIYYVNQTSQKYQISDDDKIVLSRKRINYPNYGLNYFNPLSFIFDLEVRDVAEYIKSVFFNGEDAFGELITYLKSKRLTFYSYNMLFARLLFPSYYFDLYESIINKKESSEKLLIYIDKINDYENFLKKAYNEISLYAPLEKINWLIN